MPIINPLNHTSAAGIVSVDNFPAIQPVNGTVSVGNFPATQTVAGAVSVSNFPATQTVAGAVSVSNFPSQQEVLEVDYTLRVDEGATYTYFGYADPGSATSGASWKIKRMTNADTTILFADGNSNFDNIWDNRGSISYS